MATAEIVYDNEILRTTVGSQVHGIAIEGTDDHDEMGVFIEPPGRLLGLYPQIDHFTWRTQPEGARSGPGDTDLVIYSLRKYLRLAIKGNPTVLLPLFAPDEFVLNTSELGSELRAQRLAFLSQRAAQRFLGYMHQQHLRMMGGDKQSRVPNRPELVEKYGWDVKYGSHALRLAIQCWELVRYGTLTLPLRTPDRNLVLDVKTGKTSKADTDSMITEIEQSIKTLLQRGTPLPEDPDLDQISGWSVAAHLRYWGYG